MDTVNTNLAHIREARDADVRFVIHPESNDVFVRSGKQVVASCEIGISLEVWLGELSELFSTIADWCTGHPAVRAAFAQPIGSRIAIYIAPASSSFDFDLGDELATLNISLARKYRVLGMIEVLQIPWQDKETFVGQSAKCIYGDSGSAH